MKKLKNLFKYFSMAFAFIGIMTGSLFVGGTKNSQTEQSASAAFSSFEKITNALPAYFNAGYNTDIKSGNDINDIYLLNTADSLNINIANNGQVIAATETDYAGKFNPAYYEQTDAAIPNSYYYFDFTSSLSLYKDLSNTQVQKGMTGENLLKGEPIAEYTTQGEFPVSSGASFVPKKLNISFNLDTSATAPDIDFGIANDHKITLGEEGCYTLVIPALVYYTDNGGATFTLLNQAETNIYYTFMVFDSSTYFKAEGTQNVDFSGVMQSANVISSEKYSKYYFYNYAYSTSDNDSINTLPSLSYNHKYFKINVKYTDIENNTTSYFIEYQNGSIVTLDSAGEEITEQKAIDASLVSEGKTKITFIELGEYEVNFEYLYIVELDGTTITYSLPLDKNLTGETYKNKSQKVFIYGYQTLFADYENTDPDTNQPSEKEFKTFNISSTSNKYEKSADITSAVNQYIKKNNIAGIDGVSTASEKIVPNTDASYYNKTILENAVKGYIDTGVAPVSTNQPPIKFITNTKLNKDYSFIYNVKENTDGTYELETSSAKPFEGFNQNTAGTYCYIIQYSYDNYMITSGTLQAAYTHYQVFFFKITNIAPSVSVYEEIKGESDTTYNEIYTRGFTNKDVFIFNNAQNNAFDAKTTITISAYNYNTDTYFFENRDLLDLTGVDASLAYQAHTIDIDGAAGSMPAETKYGVRIKNTAAYANAKFTVTISSKAIKEPSVQTFTIDTSSIVNVNAYNADKTSSTYYTLADMIAETNITNRLIAMSWDEKNSGAATYGYLKHIPFTSKNDYPTGETELSNVLSQFVEDPALNLLPATNQINLKGISNWAEYTNSQSYSSNLPATNVRSESGIYILQVYDEAGNYTFKVFMIDKSAPVFVQKSSGDYDSYNLIQNSSNLSVPDERTRVSIMWTDYKGLYIGKEIELANPSDYAGYAYSGIKNTSFKEALNDFFAGRTKYVESVPHDEFVGHFFLSQISDVIYVKDRASTYTAQTNDSHTYEINFFKMVGGEKEADEGTCKIIVRDESNGYTFPDQQYAYLNYPSSYLSFNITSDRSELTIYQEVNGVQENMEGEAYSKIIDLYYQSGESGPLQVEEQGNPSAYDKKYSYSTPIKTTRELFVSFIPKLNSDTYLDLVKVQYYPYLTQKSTAQVLTYEDKDGKEYTTTYYYYYQDVSKTATITQILLDKDEAKNYGDGVKLIKSLSLGPDSVPLAGKYVLTREYVQNETTKNLGFDFFSRQITFYVDNSGIISALESVNSTTVDELGNTVVNKGLESIIGGDIVLNTHSNQDNVNISVSFPTYNQQTGINSGSFYTKASFNNEGDHVLSSLDTNKLPVTLHIPKYKYTISSVKNAENKFDLKINDNLSYFGDIDIVEEASGNFSVILESNGDKVSLRTGFISREAAYDYLYNGSRTDDPLSITGYELSAFIQWTSASNPDEKAFYTTKIDSNASVYHLDTIDNYLKFYHTTGLGGTVGGEVVNQEFTKPGTYQVTLYQGANDPTQSLASIYNFSFKITAAQPTFDIRNVESGYKLTPVYTDAGGAQVYYTNADRLKLEWEDPTDPYLAKIDKAEIWIQGSRLADSEYHYEKTGDNTYEIDINPLAGCVATYKDTSLKISFQFENHDALYYSPAEKIIHFDVEAPSAKLEELMETTAKSAQYFSTTLQKRDMREYVDYKGETFNPVLEENADKVPSYIYNVDSGVFRNFAFTVDKTFFSSLKDSFYGSDNKIIDGKNISEVYYQQIEDIENYNQADKSTYIGNYTLLSLTDVDTTFNNSYEKNCYYEIIETDWAGNRTIYIVYLTDNEILDHTGVMKDAADNIVNDAITYTDHISALLGPDGQEYVTHYQINSPVRGFDIYANTDFKISNLEYNQDAWLYFVANINGKEIHYFKSPWLESNQIYKITNISSVLSYSIVYLDVETHISNSSSNKHSITFANRTLGETKDCYITVMDSSLVIQKVLENVEDDTATIAINTPTTEQEASRKIGYIFPQHITVEVHDGTDWVPYAKYNQEKYGTWTPEAGYEGLMEFSLESSSTVTRLHASVKAGANQRVKFTVVDNFGNSQPIISLTGNAADEIVSTHGNKLFSVQGETGVTYISNGPIVYTFNTVLYNIEYQLNAAADGIKASPADPINLVKNPKNMATVTFMPETGKEYFDGYYTVTLKDTTDGTVAKVFYVRIINRLPSVETEGTSPENGLVFLDNKHQNLGADNISLETDARPIYLNLEKDGKVYAGAATSVTTYSRNVTVRFPNGLKYANASTNYYDKGITYSAYISKDGGLSWERIDNPDISQPVSYIVSGEGTYYIIIEYNEEDILTNSYKLFELNMLDADSSYYYITVDSLAVSRSEGIKYSNRDEEYEVTYIVSLEYANKASLKIHKNEELEVEVRKVKTIYLGTETTGDPDVPSGTIVTEIWTYSCDEAKGDFVIIYVPQSHNIVGTLSCELPDGEEDLKEGIDKQFFIDMEKYPRFNTLKISFSSSYGIPQNEIKPIVYKVVDGKPIKLNTVTEKENDDISYITLDMAGTYYLQVIDSCTPANSQAFSGKTLNGYDYIEITFISTVPFDVITTDETGEKVVRAPIQKAVYNSAVTLALPEDSTYYLSSSEQLTIEATRNGETYSPIVESNTYTFVEPGFYKVKFNAKSSTGVLLRAEEYSFAIVNKNESRYAFEFSSYKNYYIESVVKDGVDITEDLIRISNFSTIMVGNKPYLSSLTLNHLDGKTGKGRYEVTVNINNTVYAPATGERFTFGLWINLAKPPITVSLEEGGASTDPIYIKFNPQTLYKAVGDCYIEYGGSKYEYTSENIGSKGESESLIIGNAGTYFIQVYTQSGHLLYSYKVTKNEPLNSFAIIAIILGIAAAGAIIFITIKLRKRQKVK